jgi:citrate lyase subunit beta/citryl-CoA lyase
VTPGHEEDKMRTALTGSADAVMLDLEDAVPPSEAARARKAVAAALEEHPPPDPPPHRSRPERMVRVEGLDGDRWLDDLEAVVEGEPDAVVLPKVASPDAVRRAGARLADLEEDAGLGRGAIPLLLVVESARAVEAAGDLAAASPRVEGLLLGSEDLAADVGLDPASEGGLAYPRGRLAMAAAARGAGALDRASMELDQAQVVKREARAAAEAGLEGKMVIHPDQLGPIHAVFTPSEEEAREALELVQAAEAADIEEGGVLRLGDRMVERPHVVRARRRLAAAEQAGVLDEDEEPAEGGALGQSRDR